MTQPTQFPHTIYETPDNWGETGYLNEQDMDECIESLIDAGGEDWADISISDCREHTFLHTFGDKAVYEGSWITDGYNRNGRHEILVFSMNKDGSFKREQSYDPKNHWDQEEMEELGIAV